MSQGLIVGCDAEQEWLLPWWWEHYSKHNDFPVAMIDWGMSAEGRRFCAARGTIMAPPQIELKFSARDEIVKEVLALWEERYAKEFWKSRDIWLKKPFALLNAPFVYNLWLDLDCQVLGSLEALFNGLHLGADIGAIRDYNQGRLLLAGEVLYNGGVIAFRQGAPILNQWIETVLSHQHLLPTDQELLARSIFLHKPAIVEFPLSYNWPHFCGLNEKTVIRHYCGFPGKLAIQEMIQ